MGTGRAILAVIIFGVAMMMVFSILPSYADPRTGGATGICPGGPLQDAGNSPWKTHHLNEGGFPAAEIAIDENGNNNDHVCHNHKSNRVMDDRST